MIRKSSPPTDTTTCLDLCGSTWQLLNPEWKQGFLEDLHREQAATGLDTLNNGVSNAPAFRMAITVAAAMSEGK